MKTYIVKRTYLRSEDCVIEAEDKEEAIEKAIETGVWENTDNFDMEWNYEVQSKR